MLWNPAGAYLDEPFELEAELEQAVLDTKGALFGRHRIYLDIKKKIGTKGKVQNIPDGYLIDLSSNKDPKLYVVENELASHDPLKHVAVQILEFSLSFETSSHQVKNIVKDALTSESKATKFCQKYAQDNGFENLDVLLERMIYGKGRFNALVIIDELPEELEKVLISRFQFPVETLTIQRYRSKSGERLYRFDPFLKDISPTEENGPQPLPPLDPAEIDTIVVPAHEEGFHETFLGEDRWYAIRMHSSMVDRIRHIAVYRVAPVSAITHIAQVASIKQWEDSNKYVVNFVGPAQAVEPIQLVQKGIVKAPQAPRYTSLERLKAAKTLDQAF